MREPSRDRFAERTVACFATQGSGSRDEHRLRSLLRDVQPVLLPFDRSSRVRSSLRLIRELRRARPALVVMEGTGIAGGTAALAARLLFGIPYVVSSGDAIGPYVISSRPWLGRIATLYERLLCRSCAGFIGWTPYLVGRALTFGAPRAMTAASWATDSAPRDRAAIRRALGIPADAIVFGIAGSLGFNERIGYCYGSELVRALAGVDRAEVHVLVVGGGDGRERLEALAGELLGNRVVLAGPVAPDEIRSYLGAMDIASLPQSVDGVGSFRYTAKLSEYIAAGLPVVTGQIPMAYDLDEGWLWRLPGEAPWDERYIAALARLMNAVSREKLTRRASLVPIAGALFDRERQQRQVAQFVNDLMRAES